MIEPFLHHRATLEAISKQHNTPVRTLYNWVTAFKVNGLTGLKPKHRSDSGRYRSAQDDLVDVIKGLYLRTPPVPIMTVYRKVQEICSKNGWESPCYDVVRNVILKIPASIKTLAHEGKKAYNQQFGLAHRFEADGPNEIWQADHSLEMIRDLYDRTPPSVLLVGSPGIERRLRRTGYGQLHSRFTLAYEIQPLTNDEMRSFISRKWDELNLSCTADDAVSTGIMRISNGNLRVLHRIFNEIKRLQKINCFQAITPDVVEVARKGLLLATT